MYVVLNGECILFLPQAPAKKKPPAKAGGGRGGKGKGGGAGKMDEPPDQPEPALSVSVL